MNTKHENVKYDYYDIECMNIVNRVDEINKLRNISASFRGKENNPNIIYTKHTSSVNYQAINIFLAESTYDVSRKSDGEIIIMHRPTTTSLKLYTCFPFVNSSDVSNDTDIDKLINSKTHSLSDLYHESPLTIEMNKYIIHNPRVTEYKMVDKFGEQCIVLFFDNIIKIKTKVDGKTLEKALFVIGTEKPVVSLLEDKLKSPAILMEGFHDLTINNEKASSQLKKSANSDVVYQCEYLPVDTDDMVQVLQVPLGSPAYHYKVGNQVSGVFVSTTILIFIVLSIFFTSPILYGFIESLLRSHTFLDDISFFKTRLNININLLNLLLIITVFLLTNILFIYGLFRADVVAIAVALFLPFFALISYVAITFFRPKNQGISILNELRTRT